MTAAEKLHPQTGHSGLVSNVQDLVQSTLAPQTVQIDRQGVYPAGFMHELGALGGFHQHLASGGARRPAGPGNFGAAINVMDAVSSECMSTGFCVWCQDALTWYLENADDPSVRDRLLPSIADGSQLGGTGLSNGMKYFASIEPLKIRLKRVDGGYIANGTLPWVSNLANDHAFAAIFQVEGSDRQVMALTFCDQPGFSLQQCAEFTALEGSGTYACHFRDCFIPDSQIISEDVPALMQRIRSGLILMQMGMGLGLVQGCIDIMEGMRETQGHVNCYLDEQPESLAEDLADARQATQALANDIGDESESLFADVLQVRHSASELALRASQAAMLHAGARGYLADAPAQRKLRESYFVAIVTPATKHLRKELERLGAA